MQNHTFSITYYLLPITYYLLPITYYLLPITYYLLYQNEETHEIFRLHGFNFFSETEQINVLFSHSMQCFR
jgi:hypothetical protein